MGLDSLRPYGIPTAPKETRQHKIEIALDGLPIPVIGYLDLFYLKKKLIIELKTQFRLPSKISAAHARQGAIYNHAHPDCEVLFAYVTPKKFIVHKLESYQTHLESVRQIAIRMERFLRLSKDPHELAALLVPDFENFMWNSPQARAAGREVFGW
jgi:hypothetical protein